LNGPAYWDLKFPRGVEIEDAHTGSGVEEEVEGIRGLGSVDLEPNHSFAVVECEVIRDLKRSSMSLEPKGCERKCQKGPERHNETIAVSVPLTRWAKNWGLLSILREDLLEGAL
jgi:hypothetical protein